jgi:hypothetical protein
MLNRPTGGSMTTGQSVGDVQAKVKIINLSSSVD